MHTKTTYNPHRSCSCRMCRAGRGMAYGQYAHRHAERVFRHTNKIALRLDPVNYETVLVRTDYTD